MKRCLNAVAHCESINVAGMMKSPSVSITKPLPESDESLPAMTKARMIGSSSAMPTPVKRTLTEGITIAVGANQGHMIFVQKPSTSPCVAKERIIDHTACFEAAYGAGYAGVDKKEVKEPVRTMH